MTAAPGAQSISFTREFEAPAARVFAAHIDPDLLARWTGPRGTEVRMREWDARTGGSWSYVVVATRDQGAGDEWAFHGSFHEVTAPRRIVQTFEFEGDPGHPTMEVLEFVDLPGGRSRIDGPVAVPVGRGARRDARRHGQRDGRELRPLEELLADAKTPA